MTCLWLVPTCLATQRVYKELSRTKQKSISFVLFFVPAMKEREDTEKKKRLYDAEGYTQRAGCLCFKTESEKEAGVQGNIVRPLGMFQNDIGRKRTMVYVLIVQEELDLWQDALQGGRKRAWFPIHEAWELLSHRPLQQSYLQELIHSKWRTDQCVPNRQLQSFWAPQSNTLSCAT
ncbi:PREDICTED: diphosphoinositol polyphosphate phosphohydrolase 1-like isoform X2 [Acropora digitifera]|uniref:diphosphoinositol polyphosphate phosphohydrolase 1-like isoform X2 n=1 Tax=Acropora digitifera TaxID=70779 RepID=UPI00077AFEDA|nr:PREDICTED: diphosphoinositol polyphosphate phosphohydrolase 1-like isoform X2 [Acropora digitifera]